MYRIVRTNGSHKGFLFLIGELDKELRNHETEHEETYVQHNIVQEDVNVVLAVKDNEAVGCACLRKKTAEKTELKRMYVLPNHRGKGLSKKILSELENWAREQGRNSIILETGAVLEAATGLYKSAGFKRIPNYPPYEHIAESLCYEKRLKPHE